MHSILVQVTFCIHAFKFIFPCRTNNIRSQPISVKQLQNQQKSKARKHKHTQIKRTAAQLQAGRPVQPEIVKGWQHLADEIRQQQQQQQTSSAAEQQQQRDQDHQQQQEHQPWDKLNK